MLKNISVAHKALKEKKISPKELAELCLKNIQLPANSYISIFKELVLREAEKITEFPSFLTGIPYSLKDLFITQGLRTTAASRYLLNYIPTYDSFVHQQFKKSGSLLIGKNNCDEFGMGSLNRSSAFGPSFYPENLDHYAGGSSGGSASAVKEKSSFFSIGTDTGGSVRLPAAFQGLWGLKPSYGRISRYGQIAYASSLDQAGIIANCPEDIAIVLDQLTVKDEKDTTQKKHVSHCVESIHKKRTKNITLGIIPEFIDLCSPLIKSGLLNFLKSLPSSIQIKELSLKTSSFWSKTYYILAMSEASSNLSRYDGIRYGGTYSQEKDLQHYYEDQRQLLGPEVQKRILAGTYFLHSSSRDNYYNKAIHLRDLIKKELSDTFSSVDFLFFPTNNTVAPKKGSSLTSLEEYNLDLFTVGISLAGLPALNIPLGSAEHSLPFGAQIISPFFQEELLLQLAQEFYV